MQVAKLDLHNGALADAALAARVRSVLGSAGRVHVPDFFSDAVAHVLADACRDAPWSLGFNGSDANYDLSAQQVAAIDVNHRIELAEVIYARAEQEFQYLFDSYRISDEVEAGRISEGVFADFFAALNAPEMLAQLRAATGDDRISYIDAQATRYRPGHFLTVHDDHQDGKDRLYAYVLNLTPKWRADWGGLLMFLSEDGHVAEAYTPRWNAFNILKVPQPHAVSVVAPFARGARYSITGWMRSRRP